MRIGIGTHRMRFGDGNGAQAYFAAVIANGGDLTDREKDAYTVYREDSEENANAWNGDTHIDLPMLGSTVESMVINAQTPGTFDCIAVNTVAGDFTANGFDPNGVNSYLDTQFNPSVSLVLQSVALEYYSREDIDEFTIEIGCRSLNTTYLAMQVERAALTKFFCYDTTPATGLLSDFTPGSNSQGGFMCSRVSNVDFRLFKNGVQFDFAATTGGGHPSRTITIGAQNDAPVTKFSNKQCAGTGVYDGLITAKVLAQYNARQLMNINCVIGGREV